MFSCTVQDIDEPNLDYYLNLSTDVLGMAGPDTKANLLNSGSGIPGDSLILYGWENSTYWIQGTKASYSSGKWSVQGSYKLNHSNNYSFFAYANMPVSGASIESPSSKDGSIKFTVTDITSAQTDVLLGYESVSAPTSGDVSMDFSHPYSSVQFVLGYTTDEVSSVSAISLDGVYFSGSTTLSSSSTPSSGIMQYNWTPGDANATLQADHLTKVPGDTIATFVVIPQDLEEHNAIVTITYDSDNKQMVKLLNSGSWEAGYTTTYTLTKIGSLDITIAGTTVRSIGSSKVYVRATISGAWYDANGNVVSPWNSSLGTFSSLPGTGWSKAGEFYYFANALAQEGVTTPLFASYSPYAAPVAGATLKLDILVQAIPYDVTKTCQEAFEAL